MSKTYRDAGVDIEKGDRFARYIGALESKAVASGIGGFSGGFELDLDRYRHPVIMTTTDGVGTKLLIAQKAGKYDTVGIDLVAMCVNDLIASGADPVSFLDYIACGKIDETMLQNIVDGIVSGCEMAGCVLTGGETAEMPDMYSPGDFDLAGFAVGVVDRESVLPKTDSIEEDAVLYGLPSAGIHSNGFSLARKALDLDSERIVQELLVPTRIYVKEIQHLLRSGVVAGIAHITGGGLEGNISRILPEGLVPELRFDWEVPWIFAEIESAGGIDQSEMKRVFNMGIGMVICVNRGDAPALLETAADIKVIEIGRTKRAEVS